MISLCIIGFSYQTHPDYPLLVVANRDEFYRRAALPLHAWSDKPIVAGRDEEGGGTWLGVSKNGRFVAITNYRDPALAMMGTYSRGQIATDFLESDLPSADFAKTLQQNRTLYGPFNVLLFDGQTLVHYNNIYNAIAVVPPGVHCISNDTLNTPWPKVEQLTMDVKALTATKQIDDEALFQTLQNKEIAADEDLPSTGISRPMERHLSAIFIEMADYGTRCSTVMKFDGAHYFIQERTFDKGKFVSEHHETV